ncbi:hypothetical protein AVU32_gp048 [Vibrio phage ValKK3]|uniref:Uncharacterized protein n=1 Tax=Vibrio phage ValKK3 TaxID=1610855 RepID=A0A0D4DA87_9CAUD|nr:hypothetical protein AVU32_gp048 [Vibrio phage ValKK3]AJT60889.1 hypothetical protein [Vibrio phage ValKK3]QBX06263.1 hypothetical protein Va3_310 [Vibrio phage Va3]QNJ55275.1 hypothetical protein vBValMR11Z_349 [Vibrio phage vB_ValM_R11Z]
MNQAVNLALSFKGVYNLSTYEIAQDRYDDSLDPFYIDSIRRRVHDELREGVEKGLLSRYVGKKNLVENVSVFRYLCRKEADKLGIVSVPYKDGRKAVPKTGIIALIEQCIAEMIVDKSYRHKKFTSIEVGKATVLQYIHEAKTDAAKKILSSHANTYEKNVNYVVKNHLGVLDDHGVQIRDLQKGA